MLDVRKSPDDLLPLPVSADGLTSGEARKRRERYGLNVVVEKAPSRGRIFISKFWAPIPWLLEFAAVIEIVIGRYVEAAVIGALLLFNALLSFIQEGRASMALAALKKRLAPTASARRDGRWVRLAAAELVPGDAIRLPLGAIIPADARIISGSAAVDQSSLTGESVPVDAGPGHEVYAGSLVRRGQAIAVVTAIGSDTYFGRAAELVRVAHAKSTEQSAILATTRNLAVVNGTVAVLIVGYAFAADWSSADVIRLALTALLATIPVALPATFTLSAALAARKLAARGVLLTRLSAVHEAAAMDVLCADKTGTLTRNELEVVDVIVMPEFDRNRVLALAALASSEADQDPIDAAIHAAAITKAAGATERLVRFVPFDPATKTSEAFIIDRNGAELQIVKGAFEVVAQMAETRPDAALRVNVLGEKGHRVIAVAVGVSGSMQLAGLIAISDPAREDSAPLIATLGAFGVRTVMVTGDSPVTARAVACAVGIEGGVCPPEKLVEPSALDFGVFARVAPEEKYRLVKALQDHGHAVGMCGDGINDAPALKQAHIGIAVASATDVAKAAAGLVLTEPGLAGIVVAVREGRIAFQRLLAFTFNMLVKKIEIVLFLALGLAVTGQAVLTPVLMVLMLVTNDFLAMSLTTDRASPAPLPAVWRMRNITSAGVVLGACKLGFSIAVLAFGKYQLGFNAEQLQTLAFVTLVFGAQALLFVLRERRHIWSSVPSNWVLVSSAADIAIVCALAGFGIFMEPLPWHVLAAVFVAAGGFGLILDQVKLPVQSVFRVGLGAKPVLLNLTMNSLRRAL